MAGELQGIASKVLAQGLGQQQLAEQQKAREEAKVMRTGQAIGSAVNQAFSGLQQGVKEFKTGDRGVDPEQFFLIKQAFALNPTDPNLKEVFKKSREVINARGRVESARREGATPREMEDLRRNLRTLEGELRRTTPGKKVLSSQVGMGLGERDRADKFAIEAARQRARAAGSRADLTGTMLKNFNDEKKQSIKQILDTSKKEKDRMLALDPTGQMHSAAARMNDTLAAIARSVNNPEDKKILDRLVAQSAKRFEPDSALGEIVDLMSGAPLDALEGGVTRLAAGGDTAEAISGIVLALPHIRKSMSQTQLREDAVNNLTIKYLAELGITEKDGEIFNNAVSTIKDTISTSMNDEVVNKKTSEIKGKVEPILGAAGINLPRGGLFGLGSIVEEEEAFTKDLTANIIQAYRNNNSKFNKAFKMVLPQRKSDKRTLINNEKQIKAGTGTYPLIAMRYAMASELSSSIEALSEDTIRNLMLMPDGSNKDAHEKAKKEVLKRYRREYEARRKGRFR